MSFLLDTDVCIEILRGRSHKALERIKHYRKDQLFLCSVVKFELWSGALKSSRPAYESERLIEFWDEMESISFNDACARAAASIRESLESKGLKIGSYDIQIAATAVHHGLTLATGNVREYQRVDGLQIENWCQ